MTQTASPVYQTSAADTLQYTQSEKQEFKGVWEFDDAARRKALAEINAAFEKRQQELEQRLKQMAADRKAEADKLGQQWEFDHAARDKALADMQADYEKRQQETQGQIQQLEQERQAQVDKINQRWRTGQDATNR